jgi:hypothetical protein
LFNEELGEHGKAAEALITDLPTLTDVEAIAERTGLVNVRVEIATEIFEFDDGKEFVASPLIEDLLLPNWLSMLDEDEQTRVVEALTNLIDAEDREMSFSFTLKMNLLTGEKV